jgi:amidase
VKAPPSRHARLGDFRVGVVLDHPQAPVSSEVGGLLSDAVDIIAQAGARVVEGWPDGVDPVRQYESFGFHVQLFMAFAQPGEDFATLAQIIEHETRRMAARAAWNRYFGDVDVFLCPANFTPAFPHGTRPFAERQITTPEGLRRHDSQPFWISHPSLPGLPAVAAPVGRTSGGLPWAPRSWVRSTRTTPRSPSPSCSPTTWAATSHHHWLSAPGPSRTPARTQTPRLPSSPRRKQRE